MNTNTIMKEAWTRDEEIAIKMLTRLKQLKREMPDKRPDVEMMLGLLDVVRSFDPSE